VDLIRSLKKHLPGGVKFFGIVSDLRPYFAFENIGDRNTGMAVCTRALAWRVRNFYHRNGPAFQIQIRQVVFKYDLSSPRGLSV
jgi:hypothetical protein